MHPLEQLIEDHIESSDDYRWGISTIKAIEVLCLEGANPYSIKRELNKAFSNRGWTKSRRRWPDCPVGEYVAGYIPPDHIQYQAPLVGDDEVIDNAAVARAKALGEAGRINV